MKRFTPILAVVLMVLTVVPVQAAGVLSDHICYWYQAGDGSIQTIVNPETSDWTWLRQNWSSVLLRVQQTVYDPESTATLLATSDLQAPSGACLFSYSVSNINWFDSMGTGGLKSFTVDWGFMPVMTTKSKWHTPPNWTASDLATGPAWTWTPPVEDPTAPGLLPGSSVGGLWALAETGDTCVTDGCARTGEEVGGVVVFGKTIAPTMLPEPVGLLAFLVGGVGLVIERRRKS